MPTSTKTHRTFTDLALPYVTNSSPISTDPQYVGGLNALTSLRGIIEKRPGFAIPLESIPTNFNKIVNFHVWQRWDDPSSGATRGAFIAMINDVGSGQSRVYKFQIGTDTSSVLIYTDTTSESPFFFKEANNQCYFGNGSAGSMKRYNGTTLNNWGIIRPSAAPAVGTLGISFTSTPGIGKTILGIALAGSFTVSNGPFLPVTTRYNYLVYNVTAHGFTKGQFVYVNGVSPLAYNKSAFIEVVGDADHFSLGYGGEDLGTVDVTGATVSSSIPSIPTVTVSDGLKITAHKAYCYTYGYGTGTGSTAVSVHESSPSDVSAKLGPFNSDIPNISLVASSDSQVNQIHVYATTDGGALNPEEMREIEGSPFANADQTVNDQTIDDNLGDTAPPFNRNDPPPPSSSGVWYAHRFWTKKSNTLYYSGFEEIGRGVPEECWPSGTDGNNRPYNNDIKGLGVLPDGVAIFNTGKINKAEGESLEFRFYGILDKRGAINEFNISSIGGTVSWIDTSGTVWNSDLGELSLDIRPDTKSIDQTRSAITTHVSGTFHWIVVMDGANGNLLVFDLDKKQWLPPWHVGDSVTAIGSFETSSGHTDLIIARNGTKLVMLDPSAYNDDGQLYSGFVNTNQFDISPERNKAWKGVIDWVEWKRNTQAPSAVKQLTDDSPTAGIFKSLTDIEASPEITQGTVILTERGKSNFPTAQLATLRFEWPESEQKWEMYSIDLASHPVGI